MNNNYQYLGTGIKWPIQLNGLGQVSEASGIELISQSIIRYLEMPLGGEFFNEDVGSRIKQIGFEPNDELLEQLLETLLNETIDYFEKRVKYIGTTFSHVTNEHQSFVQCRVVVRILESNQVDSFIWPYYREKPTQR